MRPPNKVKQLRNKKGLSQRQLAALVGTSQAQIQRVESGVQPARLEVAFSICQVLGEPLVKVFPKVAKLVKKNDDPVEAFMDPQRRTAFKEAGLDTDPEIHTLKAWIAGFDEPFWFRLASQEKDRVRSVLANIDPYNSPPCEEFVIFDTLDSRIALNTEHLDSWQFLFDRPTRCELPEVHQAGLEVWIRGRKDSLCFNVGPDQESMEEEEFDPEVDFSGENWADTQLQTLFSELEDCDNHVVTVMDLDGEMAYFPRDRICFLKVPLSSVELALAQAEYDGDEDALFDLENTTVRSLQLPAPGDPTVN